MGRLFCIAHGKANPWPYMAFSATANYWLACRFLRIFLTIEYSRI